MTTSTFDNVFKLYYTMYRMVAVVPGNTDDEYTIALVLASEAIARWATYDNTYWKQLFTTAQNDITSGALLVFASGTSAYHTNSDFKELSGYVRVLDSVTNNTVQRIPIIDPQEAQFRGDNTSYAFVTLDPADPSKSVINFNPAVGASLNQQRMDYVYYKKPTEMTNGSSVTECPNAEYIAHRMLAMRFRGSRNPFVADAKKDAEDALKIMKMDNDSGSWSNPWKVPDRSGSIFGV